MTILKSATNKDIEQCDGCGRTDTGPGTSIDVKEYLVHDPNVGSKVKHHYCGGCAGNRNADLEELDFGWGVVGPVVEGVHDEHEPVELPELVEAAPEASPTDWGDAAPES